MLPAESRLRHADEFRDTLRQGVRCGRSSMVVHARLTAGDRSRAGFIVARTVGNAVKRNRVKRQLRHLVAASLPELPFTVDLVVRALPGASRADLRSDFDQALGKCVERLAA